MTLLFLVCWGGRALCVALPIFFLNVLNNGQLFKLGKVLTMANFSDFAPPGDIGKSNLYLDLTTAHDPTRQAARRFVDFVRNADQLASDFWYEMSQPPSPLASPSFQQLRQVVERDEDYERAPVEPEAPIRRRRRRRLDFEDCDIIVHVEQAPSRRRRTASEMLQDQNRRYRRWKK